MKGVNQTCQDNVMYALVRIGGEWSFDNMITSSKYECYDFAYDPT